MQQGVTVALATVLLASMMGAASLPSYPYFDQYSPLSPNLPEGLQGPNWKDQDAEGDHLDTRRIDLSIDASDLPPFLGTMLSNGSADGPLKVDLGAYNREDAFTSDNVPSQESGRFEEIALKNPKLLEILEDEEASDRTMSSREDAFVADDNFQDQGPGSVEVYKLDLFKDRSMLSPVVPKKTLLRAKSKTPKKANASQVNWKPKIVDVEVKMTQPRIMGQTNFFDKFPSDSVKDEVFGVGGVPELQVGCEGLEAWHRQKRSETSNDNGEFDPTLHVTPLSVDLDLSEDEEDETYEEMDELLKIQKMLTTTKKPPNQKNRGDIEATLKTPADLEAKLRKPDKLPVRGDLGESTSINSTLPVGFSSSIVNNSKLQGESKLDREYVYSAPIGRQNNLSPERDASPLAAANSFQSFLTRGRKLLSIVADIDLERGKREILWGFGEDEGMIVSEESNTEEKGREREKERKRMEMEHARRQEEDKRYTASKSLAMQRNVHLGVEKMRQEYEENLKRQMGRNREHPRDYSGLSKGREEDRKRQLVNEEERWQEEKRRVKERRRQEEERRILEEQVRSGRYPSSLTRSESPRSSDDRMRAEEERRMQEQDRKLRDYIQRNRPIAVVRPGGRGTAEEERRRTLEKGRNRSSNSMRMTSNNDRDARNAERQSQENGKEERQRERRAEERKLQDYIRRNQPVNIFRRMNETFQHGNNALEERRVMEKARKYDRRSRPNFSGSDGRNHGPSPPTNVGPRRILLDESWRRQDLRKLEEDRRRLERLRYEEEEKEKRKMEFARREDERRRAESRRYEEDRKRQEAVRIEAEKRRRELIEEEERRAWFGRREPARVGEVRRRQETSLTPANLVLDVNRKRQEQDRRRLEAWRRAQSYERHRQNYERGLMEQKHKEESTMSLREHQAWRRQEQERLNSLPVSARIILRSKGANNTTESPQINFSNRFKDEFDPPGINPYRQGLKAAHFPTRATERPPVKGPGACVWAVLQCCSSKNRLNSCFESAGCPGISWDPNPCRSAIVEAARTKAMQFYAAADNN